MEKLKSLKNLLLTYPGDSQVTLKFEGTGRELNLSFGVLWSKELSHKIEELLHS